jgi:hypothetical protein
MIVNNQNLINQKIFKYLRNNLILLRKKQMINIHLYKHI